MNTNSDPSTSTFTSTSTSTSTSTDDDNNKSLSDIDSLTLDELAQRLRLVRTQSRELFSSNPKSQEAILAQLELCDEIQSTRFRNLAIHRTEVRSSSVHGKGLFATRDIFENELITLYPGDALLAWDSDGPGPRGCPLRAVYGPHVTTKEQADSDFFLLQDTARDYEIVTGKRRSVVGDPKRDRDAAYLGHMANDAINNNNNNNRGEQQQQPKEQQQVNAVNLTLEGCHTVTLATRLIKKDQEILVSYGEGYWKSKMMAGKDSNSNSQKRTNNDEKPKGFGKT